MSEPIRDDRLRNVRAWAAARLGQLSGAEVIVGAIDELLQRRADALNSHDTVSTVHHLLNYGDDEQRAWAIETILGDGSQAFELLAQLHAKRMVGEQKLTFHADGSWEFG